ncbi:MAG: four helix bundle protein [Parcubacteria group bacterium]|nr:four helix bundle protein [Parcubacteria group bacterium]
MSEDIFRGSYKNTAVWQKSFLLSQHVYRLTESFPDSERFGLTSQMRRASISIPSNIAEGYGRYSKKHLDQFLRVAYGSAFELETQIALAKTLPHTKHAAYDESEILLTEVIKLLYVMLYR